MLDIPSEPTSAINAALDAGRRGDQSAGRAILVSLQERLPFWDEVPLRLAESFREEGEISAAAAAYERVLDLNPRRPEALLALGVIRLREGQIQQAQSLFLQCCGVAPDLPEAWDALGASLLRTRDMYAAESAFAQAQSLSPDSIAFSVHRAEAAFQAGCGPEEVGRLECILAEDPTNAPVLTALGESFERLGRRSEAIDFLNLAATLRPDDLLPVSSLAQVLARANRLEEALTAFDRAIELTQKLPGRRSTLDLRNNRAATLIRQHRFREAAQELESLIEQHGEHTGLLNNLANALVSLGRQAEGAEVARRATAAERRSSLAWRSLCNALPYCEGTDGQTLLATVREASRVMPRHGLRIPSSPPDPERRLRVGLLSPTLKTHPVGWLTIAGFENLDPREFELHAIGAEHGRDPIFRRFRQVTESWTILGGQGGPALAQQIHGLGLDILIDLGGYGDQGYLPLCAERLAPVQVKWVGSQNHSTGMDEIDWFLTDPRETPDGFERFYSERLARLPDGYVCYSPPSYAPDVAPLPALWKKHITFGCFNNLAKITPRTLSSWAAVLRAVPGSHFVLKCHQMNDAATRDALLAAFSENGIDKHRIDLRGGSPHRALLQQYGDVDIVLDPFPYTGGLTTCEALWMGVPVVTMPGEIFASRHSTSHLANVGLHDWIASDHAEYEAIAIARASDVHALAELRANLRSQMKVSPLCDAPRFGRNLGVALRGTWRDWCSRAILRHAA